MNFLGVLLKEFHKNAPCDTNELINNCLVSTYKSNERLNMKNIFLSILFVIFASSAFAGSCPMLWGELDSEIKIAKQSGMSSDKVDLIQKLRDSGKQAHDDGDHAKSEILLNEALILIKS